MKNRLKTNYVKSADDICIKVNDNVCDITLV